MRRNSKPIQVGNTFIGVGSPISIQSMPRTDTRDIRATVDQIREMADAGCDIARVAVPDMAAVNALSGIKKIVGIPIIADVHFNGVLAIAVMNRQAADQVRINPGNIKQDVIEKIVKVAKVRQIPVRIGINVGSLKHEPEEHVGNKMVEEAMSQIDRFEDMGFDLIEISLKSSDVRTTVEANVALAGLTNYPIHIGVTEAGPVPSGYIKSAVGIGGLLLRGIGDSIRVSLTSSSPVEEIFVAQDILKSLGLRGGPKLVSCPTCGRCEVKDWFYNLVDRVDQELLARSTDMTIAVMGCSVNGPGEAKDADVGIACGKGSAVIFEKGQKVGTIKDADEDRCFREIMALVDEIDNDLPF